ncbi:MAG: DUF1489 domain-containing protein [Proteobacteria bacterium]|nr:DUF1489 domain-containing protein [Pseudomonadota bacterium]
MPLHILKMCVGVDSVEDLAERQARRLADARRAGRKAELRHLTRSVPRRAEQIVGTGSIYWIIKGFVRCRQGIVRIDRIDDPESTKRCAFVLHRRLVRTFPQPRKPHQGWRYLEAEDAPPDLDSGVAGASELPPDMAAELRALGLI